ncbi:MAG: 50S ribosomal protein L5 [Planctomycetaceae bacterium]|nr:50S ribosomal protein L5 [Planctomycetaceae bacterium]
MPSVNPRLKTKYGSEIVPAMRERFGYPNVMAVPRIEKITVSMGVGKATENQKVMEAAVTDLAQITGQRPVVTRSRKSISQFRLRQGQAVGCKVTLRGARMYEFLDRLISVVIPRIRDFRGLRRNAFDGRGNYNFGLTDQLVFPEVNLDKVDHQQGMNITITIRNGTNETSLELLRLFGMPFRTN